MNGLNIHIYGLVFMVLYNNLKLLTLIIYKKFIHKGQIG